MFGITRKRPRHPKQDAPVSVRRLTGIEAGLSSVPAWKGEGFRILEQAAGALEKMQSRCAALEAELADSKRAHAESVEERRSELLRSDEKAARLEELAAELKEVALAQRDALRRSKAERAEKDERIARLEDALARYQDEVRSALSAAGRAAPGVPRQPEFPALVGDPRSDGSGRLDDDEDVIRFREHMERLMAA